MKYKIRVYGDTKYLIYNHEDGMEILSLTTEGLVETIKAYNDIYYKG